MNATTAPVRELGMFSPYGNRTLVSAAQQGTEVDVTLVGQRGETRRTARGRRAD